MKLADMTNQERSLLLYLESRAVDHGGTVDTRMMNEEEMTTAKQWTEKGFVTFGRLASECLKGRLGVQSTHCVTLSEEAWTLAHLERRARHERLYAKRWWYSTAEKRAAQAEAEAG